MNDDERISRFTGEVERLFGKPTVIRRTGVTDEDRRKAAEKAHEFYQNHIDKDHHDRQISTAHRGEEIMYVGLLGQYAFKNDFGVPVDERIRDGGDGGVDGTIELLTPSGPRKFFVDVKVTHYNGPDVDLKVRIDNRFKPGAIYVGGVYLKDEDDIDLRCWEWGRVLRDEGRVKPAFNNAVDDYGNPIKNYTKPMEQCRSLTELRDRLIRKPPATEVAGGNG